MEMYQNGNNREKMHDFNQRFELIDKYYSRHCQKKHVEFHQKLSVNDNSGQLFLSLEDWLELHLKVHEEIICYFTLEEENRSLKKEFTTMQKEILSLKRTLIENYKKVADFNIFYS